MPETRRPSVAAGSGVAVRAAAARVVHQVCERGRSLTDALAAEPIPADDRDAGLLRELTFGTLRLLPRLQSLVGLLLQRPLKPSDRVLEGLLLIGLYQLNATRIPAHAAVSATVAATRVLAKPHAAGLINATLRRFEREQAELLAQVDSQPAARWLFPDWLLTRLQQVWPRHWEAIVTASNGRGPLMLRVNPLRAEVAGLRDRLAAQGIDAQPLPGRSQGLLLGQAIATSALPGYAEGQVSVQDGGAQWAATLLDPQPGERVLDACSAPGGKGAHLLELAGGDLALTAVDSDPARLETVRLNLGRLGLNATLLVADATAAGDDWPGAPYRRILLDVPCSATGVIRRHPDIKRLRRDSDIPALVATQAAMLAALWPLLEPGGRLLYATCSLLPEENEGQVRAFLAAHGDAQALPMALPEGLPRSPGWQLLPGNGDGDGFYYALIEKAAG